MSQWQDQISINAAAIAQILASTVEINALPVIPVGVSSDDVIAIQLDATGQTVHIKFSDLQLGSFAPVFAGEAKGDIIAYDGADWLNLPVDTDGFVLSSDSGELSGLKWVASPSALALQGVTDLGATTTNLIRTAGLEVVDANNYLKDVGGVLTLSTDTSLMLKSGSDAYIEVGSTYIQLSSEEAGSDKAVRFSTSAIDTTRTFDMPNASGVIPLSVNGYLADALGNILVPNLVTPITTKGDIYTYATVEERLAVGTDGFVLSADSGELTGLKWIASSGSATALSVGTITSTTFGITSDGSADDVILLEANTTQAGLLGADKWDEIVANTSKSTNVTTNLTLGTLTSTTMDVNSSDGTNATLIEADTTNAGLLGSDKWDEIVANTAKVSNVNHTGDVQGDTVLTIQVDAVDIAMLSATGSPSATTYLRGDNVWAAYLVVGEGTGVLTGGVLSTGTGSDEYSITDGTGQIADSDGSITAVAWSGKNNITPTNLATHLITFVAINSSGNVVESTSRFTNTESRTLIILGVAVHVDKVNVDVVNNEQHVAYNTQSQLYDLMEGIGFFNVDGNLFTDSGANLNIDKTVGDMFAAGSNYYNDIDDPHPITLSSLSALTFQYRFSDGTNDTTGIVVDPANLDDGAGGLTALTTNNKWSIQRIYTFTSNNIKIQRGIAEYDTQAKAIAAITTEAFVTEPSILANGLLRSFLIVRKNATDLSNIAEAIFIEAPKFGTGGGGGSASSITDLSLGTISATTMLIISSDGNDVTLIEADTNDAGLLGADKWDEIVANTLKTSNIVQTDIADFTGTKAEFDTALTDGDFLYIGDIVAPTGLESITETTTGWRYIGRNAANFGDIGTESTDFSSSSGASSTRGATGFYNLAGGVDVINDAWGGIVWGNIIDLTSNSTLGVAFGSNHVIDGYASVAMGDNNDITGGYGFAAVKDNTLVGDYLVAIGQGNTLTAYGAAAWGDNSILTGDFSKIVGTNLFVRSLGEVAVGAYNTDYTADAPTTFDVDDRAFCVGIGETGTPADGMIILKSGRIEIPKYGTQTFTGTAAYFLAVDSAGIIIEEAIPGGSPTTLSIGTVTATTFGITSDGGTDDVVLPEANTTQAGLLGADKWDEIVANTAKTGNVNHTGDVQGDTVLTIQVDAVDIAMLSATGTPDNTTFLRGDNTWDVPVAGGGIGGSITDNQIAVGATIADDIEGTSDFTWNGSDLNLYENVAFGDPTINIGSSAAESFKIRVQYATAGSPSNRQLQFVNFETYTSSTAGSRGRYIFDVDEVEIFAIDDTGVNLVPGMGYGINGVAMLTATILHEDVQLQINSFNDGTGATGSTFWRGDGTWASPGGSGDMVLADTQIVTGEKTFDNTKMKLRNVADTFDGYFLNTNTANRIYTLQDSAGTLAYITRTIVGITGTKAQFDTAVTDGDFLYVGDVTSNISTALSIGTITSTTFGITSDGGADDVVLPEANTTQAGLLGADKWDEIVANTLKTTFPGFSNVAADYSGITSTDAEINLLDLAGLTTGWVLSADSATTASWKAATGGGDVTKVGTPLNDQVGIWTGDGTIEGSTGLTYQTNSLRLGVVDNSSGQLRLYGASAATGGNLLIYNPGSHDGDDDHYEIKSISGELLFGGVTTGAFLTYNSASPSLKINDYGGGTITGTAAYILAVDSSGNIIEEPTGGGSPTVLSIGTITATTFGITSDGSADDVVLPEANTTQAGLLGADKWDEIVANTAKNTNVTTDLALGAITGTTMIVTSSDGTDVTLIEADTDDAGLLGAAKWDEIVANTLKNTNVSTDLSMGTVDGTQYIIASSDGNNVSLPLADTNNWGIISDEIFDEIVANNAKSTNVTTNLSLGTLTATTMDVNSSDGTDVTLIEADTTNAGLLGSNKWDEIVANTAKTTFPGFSNVAADYSGITSTDAEINLLDLAGLTTGWVLSADSATTASWKAATGGGDVTKVGTPLDNQVGIWTGDGTIEGSTGLIFDSNQLSVGLNDAASGIFVLYGSSGSTGGQYYMYNGGTGDGVDNYYLTEAISGEFIIKGNTSGEFFNYNSSTNEIVMAQGELNLGANDVTAANLWLYGAATTTGGSMRIYNGATGDTDDDFYEIEAQSGEFRIGGATTGEFFKYDSVNQDITIADYGSGTVTGTATFMLAVTSAGLIVEEALPSGGSDTDLALGTLTATTMIVTSSTGTDVTLIEADTTNAGLLGSDKWDEIVANSLKNTNVSTDLALGAITATTMIVTSSDGNDVTLISADTNDAGLLTAAKWDEIVANTAKVIPTTIVGLGGTMAEFDTECSDGDFAYQAETIVVGDHGTDSTDEVVNVCYGTGSTPPTANTTTEGTLYIQYTA